jgi:gluconate 5-dehydrogenase
MIFKKNVCIVTGGANGNGLGIVTRLVKKGFYTISVDLKNLQNNISDIHIIGDVSDEMVINKTFDHAISLKADSYYLINNAGITLPNSNTNKQDWDNTLCINLTAPYLWSKRYSVAVLEGVIKKGAIVNIGSLASTFGFPDNPAYQASKSGILGLTRAYAYDLGSYGIRVNCVSPGYIHTNMTNISYTDEVKKKQRTRQTLLGRWGSTDDVANAVAFLCSNESDYISGINLPVDGGWSCKGIIVD